MIVAQPARYQHVNSYVSDLRSLTGYYTGWIDQQYADSPSSDPDNAFNTIMNDPSVYHAMNLLSLWAAGEYVEVSVKNNEVLTQMLNRAIGYVQDFSHARKSLSFGGILFGLGVQKKYFQEVVFPEAPGLRWQVPVAIREVDRRRMRIERDPENKNNTKWCIWSPVTDNFVYLKDRAEFPDYQAGYTLQDFVWYVGDYEETYPFGRGLGEVLYPLCSIKKYCQQYWADLAESWSKPFLVMMVDSVKASIDASLGSGLPTSARRVQDLLRAMESSRARHSMVLDKSDELRALEQGSIGTNILSELMTYLDKKINLAILATELVTESGGGQGSYAMAQIHRGSTQSVVMYHRNRLEEIIKRDIMQDFFIRNRKNLTALGWKVPERHEISVEIKVRSEEQKDKILQQAGSAGAAKLASQV